MTGWNQYRAFGLNIHSEQPLRSLMACESDTADVTIRRGEIAELLSEDWLGKKFANWRASKNCFLLEVDNVAKYLVRNGNEIWIEPMPGVADIDIDAFLMGSTMAAMLQQREILTLHASAIGTKRGAVLFIGKSGVGKSTCLSAMLNRGYEMIADDVSAIRTGKGEAPLIIPSFPTTRLRTNSLKLLGKQQETVVQLRAELDKFLLPVENFCTEPQPIHKIFLLKVHNQPRIEFRRLAPVDCFKFLSKYTFRKKFYDGHGLQQFHFSAATDLAKSVEMVEISRPETPVMIDDLVEEIILHIEHSVPQTPTAL